MRDKKKSVCFTLIEITFVLDIKKEYHNPM